MPLVNAGLKIIDTIRYENQNVATPRKQKKLVDMTIQDVADWLKSLYPTFNTVSIVENAVTGVDDLFMIALPLKCE